MISKTFNLKAEVGDRVYIYDCGVGVLREWEVKEIKIICKKDKMTEAYYFLYTYDNEDYEQYITISQLKEGRFFLSKEEFVDYIKNSDIIKLGE